MLFYDTILAFSAAPANGDEIQVHHIGFASPVNSDVASSTEELALLLSLIVILLLLFNLAELELVLLEQSTLVVLVIVSNKLEYH